MHIMEQKYKKNVNNTHTSTFFLLPKLYNTSIGFKKSIEVLLCGDAKI